MYSFDAKGFVLLHRTCVHNVDVLASFSAHARFFFFLFETKGSFCDQGQVKKKKTCLHVWCSKHCQISS